VDANYEQVFAADQVQRLDITIEPSVYQQMQDNLEELYGDDSGQHPGPPPPQAIDACVGQLEGEACSYEDSGEEVEGFCRPGPDHLVCAPEGDKGSKEDMEEPMWVPVTVAYEDKTWPYVGMRYKGNSSLSQAGKSGGSKFPFRLDFDEFEDDYPEIEDQRFYGFKKLTFASGFKDDSYLRDTLAAALFEAFGVPVARMSFIEIHVDVGEGSVYYGLYTMIEDPSDAMMDRVFGDGSGNLYKPNGTCSAFTCFDEENFKKKSNDEEADWSDILAVVDVMEDTSSGDEAWRESLLEWFDAEGFLSWLAINTAMENWDSYGQTPHNYYVYGEPSAGGRLTWIPWDHNEALNTGSRPSISPGLNEVGSQWPLIRRLADDEVFGEFYRQELARVLELDLFDPDALGERAETLQDLIRPSVEAEEDPYTQLPSQSAFDQSVTGAGGLVDHMVDRRIVVEQALNDW